MLFSNKMLAIRAGIYKMLARIVNWEDADQIASLGISFWQLAFIFRTVCKRKKENI